MGQKKSVIALVTASPNDDIASMAAIEACQKLMQTCNLDHVFFYLDGVYHALEDSPFIKEWMHLSSTNNIPLFACSTLTERRNITNTEATPFEFLGLSEFYTRLHSCDKLVQV